MTTRDDAVAHFATSRWTAGVVGLGYVGLPLAITAAEAGLPCIGFDVSQQVIDGLRRGHSHVGDVPDERLARALRRGFEVTTVPARLKDADALLLCVPSPLGRNRQPDMSFIESAAAVVGEVSTPGTLVALESTSYPGTTDDIIATAATATGLEIDRDVFVAFSPERIDPGNERSARDIPKVVGGVSRRSGDVAVAAYQRLFRSVHRVSSARVAEMTKLLENTYRAVNIALVNELAQLAHRLDIDVWEVITAAATKPFGYQPFFPGPGVGGHCIPLDPQFLAWRAREANVATRFIDLAEQINSQMPEYTSSRISDLLNAAGKPVHHSRVLVVGVAYKANVADDRESPAWDVVERLARRGADLVVHDPVVGSAQLRRRGHRTVDDIGADRGFDIAVVLTDHDAIDLRAVSGAADLVFDTRGAYRRRGVTAPNVTAL